MRKKKLIYIFLALMLILSACSFFAPEYKEGVYEGQAYGFNKDKKPIRLSVAIDSKARIRDITILEHSETDEIGGEALKVLIKQVLDSQNSIQDLEIDDVSNATQTSRGFIRALNDALEKAKNN
ncbi:MAG: FMN-binding protein [Tissierellia bacterium]|nr:FMN-binding protein [Tissierellia bacterium]